MLSISQRRQQTIMNFNSINYILRCKYFNKRRFLYTETSTERDKRHFIEVVNWFKVRKDSFATSTGHFTLHNFVYSSCTTVMSFTEIANMRRIHGIPHPLNLFQPRTINNMLRLRCVSLYTIPGLIR
jgi:hypothetical protein